ncbi:M28 family peptidase [Asticcacaulis sp. DXS10W]|uniref:M28 family peptidase n=1 Tax=Asticcacaulis currens TaxID=2984210 RepID=A0ABT5II40_9CAUL|nr:M28 family peptidase [Asticcacaulis currens]MDC7695873.1 M28 family peptidase [Asticcacaulis currens]
MKRTLVGLGLMAGFAASGAVAQVSGGLDGARISQDVQVLASDAFEGRAPGTAGEAKTIAWLSERFKALGLEPGGENDTYLQTVPLTHTRLSPPSLLSLRTAAGVQPLIHEQDIYLATARPVERLSVKDRPLVFVGYGVKAPERQRDDFKGVDLKGKIAVFLINDPDFEAAAGEPVAGRFGGRAMTWYGRWVYKYEIAARLGAAGALIIHETPGAGYGWSTVTAPHSEVFDVVRQPDALQAVPFQGWLSGAAAEDLFRKAGLDLKALRVAARRDDFKPVAIGDARLSIEAAVKSDQVQSHNVIARLPGKTRPDESILYGAHWDAYGIGPADAQGRTIRPGANDDGLGTAAVLEIARQFVQGPRPDRSVVFALWTAEERGLLGSETYANRPTYPLETTVANITLDVLQTAGKAKDMVLIGMGQNDLEDRLATLAAAQGRTLTPDSAPERGLFYRADHFSVAKRGVPTLLIMGLGGGADLIEGGRPAGERWVADYTANCYHKTCDAWSADWDLSGAVEDIDLAYRLGRDLAHTRDWPQWKAGSEFRPVRDKSAGVRK